MRYDYDDDDDAIDDNCDNDDDNPTWLAQSAEQHEETPELSSEAQELPLPCLHQDCHHHADN